MSEASWREHMKKEKLIHEIGGVAFCDNGTMIPFSKINDALEIDREDGFRDPTFDEIVLLVQGGEDGQVPSTLRAEHPALDTLLRWEMT